MTATTMLKVSAVTRQFGGFKAVDGVSLQLKAGEILGIAGTNGAGKSTLFAAIAGQQPADAGQIHFEGQDITRIPRTAEPGWGWCARSRFRESSRASRCMRT